MKLRTLAWVVLMIAASVGAGWILLSPWKPQNSLELFAVMVFLWETPLGVSG